LRSAIDAYTTHAAYASYDELRKGTLARGMLADIVILSNDIFEARPNALAESAVTVTIFDGKIVYQRPPAASSND
jgi:predicted amidohydrolase YtcJ